MFLYCTPNGSWFGTEANWKAATIAEGHDPKLWRDRAKIEVPTDKPGLMDFLTFNHVNVVNPRDVAPVVLTDVTVTPPPATSMAGVSNTTVPTDLDTLFMAAPLGQQLTLAAIACENGYKAGLRNTTEPVS